jgi:DNA-binding transcriptional LysR family regulator
VKAAAANGRGAGTLGAGGPPSGSTARHPRPRDPWMAIELRHMAALEALAKERSFRGAADELGYVQSAVSQQLFALERIIGARLVDRERGHKPVSLTAAGELLLEHIDAITGRLGLAHAELNALSDGRAGVLRVGIHRDAGPSVLPSITRAMARQWPEIGLELTELASDAESLRALEVGSLDACFMLSAPSGTSLQGEGVLRDRFVLLVPAESPLASASPLETFESLAGKPLVLELGDSELEQLREALPGLEAGRSLVTRTASPQTAIALATAGRRAALISRLAVGEIPAGLAVVELGEPAPRRTLCLMADPLRAGEAPIEPFRVLARIVCDDIERSLRPGR